MILSKLPAKTLLTLALLLSVTPYLALTFFSHPAFDDFCIGAQAITTGFFERQIYVYNNSAGKYFSTIVLTFNPLNRENFFGYQILALTIIVLTFLALFSFVSAFLRPGFSLTDRLLATSFLTSLFSNQTPDITEAYYFMTANIIYQLPTILTLLFFALALRSPTTSKLLKTFLMVVCCLLIVAIVGSSETSMLMLGLGVFTITVAMWVAKTDQRWRWLVFLVLTIICAAIVIAAPGNAVRSSNFPERQRFFFSLQMSLKQEARLLFTWLLNPAFILGTFFFVPLANRLSDKISGVRSLSVHPFVSSLVLLVIVFSGCFPPYWATGTMGQFRTANVACLFFLVGWFVNIYVWVDFLKRKYRLTIAELPTYVYALGVPLLLCALFFSNNTKVALTDLASGRAYRYDQAVKQRYSQFRQCAREAKMDTCRTTAITDLPTTITNPYYEVEMECEKRFWKIRAQSSGPK